MSKYRTYAKELETAFLKSREVYREAADALEKAEKRKADASEWRKETYVGQREVETAKANAKYIEAKSEFDRIANTVWHDFNRERDRLTAELREAVKRDNIVNPESVDNAALAILQAGICTADDLTAMVSRFSDNPTMLRLCGKAASDGVQNAHSTEEAAKLRYIAETVKQGVSATEAAWNDILYATNVCTGQAHGKGDRAYTVRMNDQWEQLVAPSVENF